MRKYLPRQQRRFLGTLFFLLLSLIILSQQFVLAATPQQVATVVQQNASQAQFRVTKPRINLRSGPGANYAIAGSATAGQTFAVVGRNQAGDWYQISLATDKTAWVLAALGVLSGDAKQIPVVNGANAAPPAAPTTPAKPGAAPATATPASAPTAGAAPTLAPGTAHGRLLYSLAHMEAKRWELWEYNFDSGANTKIGDWRTEVDVSKDGKQIVYYAWPPDVNDKFGIWIMDSDFTHNRLVIRGGAYPSFSPGGDRFVANGGETLYIVTTDGKNVRPLTNGEYPAWNPVTNQIAHRACVGGGCGLWLIDADSDKPNARGRITTGGSDGQPAWSPDGKRLAYISQDDGNFEIYAVNADGGNKARLTTNPTTDGLPVWSPDGKWIAFRSDRDGKWGIYIMRPDGSNVHKVIEANVLPLWFFEKMDWR